MWDEAKALLEGKFTSLRAYIKEKEKYQVNNVSSHLRELEEVLMLRIKSITKAETFKFAKCQ